MLMNLRNKIKNQKGFTLVELMVVIAIIGVLAAIAVPKFNNSTNAAKDAKLKADLRTVDSALVQYYATNNDYPLTADVKTKLVGSYIGAWPKSTDNSTDLSYEHTVNTAIYKLSGTSTSSAADGAKTRYSPGSDGYVAW